MASNIPTNTDNVITIVDNFNIGSAEFVPIDIDITPLAGIDAVNADLTKIVGEVLKAAPGVARFIGVRLIQGGSTVFTFGLGVAADWDEESPMQVYLSNFLGAEFRGQLT